MKQHVMLFFYLLCFIMGACTTKVPNDFYFIIDDGAIDNYDSRVELLTRVFLEADSTFSITLEANDKIAICKLFKEAKLQDILLNLK